MMEWRLPLSEKERYMPGKSVSRARVMVDEQK